MKRFLFLIMVVLLIGCSQAEDPIPPAEKTTEVPETTTDPPTETIATRPVWIKNAKWETVRTDDLKASIRASRTIDSLDALNEEIATHNAANPADPWRIYIDTVPSIEDAPMCEVWVADFVTNVLKIHPTLGTPFHLLVPRTDVVGRVAAWEADAAQVNGKLYLDYPPPAEVEPPAPPTAEEIHLSHYHYVIDPAQNGKIIFSVNCVDDWVTLGYPSMEQCHTGRTTAFNFETMGTGYVRVDGYVYTEPE